MKKVLIISYFFPPSNLTAANRLGTWYDNLTTFDIFPIVLTRNWSKKAFNEYQRLESFGKRVEILNSDKGEIHYLPYTSSLRDKVFIKGQKNRLFKFLSKTLTFLNLFLQNFSLKFIPYSNLYTHAIKLLEQDKEIETVIISANPFEQFFFGFLLKKKFPHIKWIADYRDDWTTTELVKRRSLGLNLLHQLEKYSERKWLSNASMFTSVSPYYVDKISRFINKKGIVIFNGFNKELLQYESNLSQNQFNITYNGSLYETQNIEIFINAFIKFIEKYKEVKAIKLFFPGLEYNKDQAERVRNLLLGYEEYYFMSDRLPKNEVIQLQIKSDLLLMVAHDGIKGVPSSKIFEYIGLRTSILLCPSDHDILKEIVEDIPQGKIAENEEECFFVLKNTLLSKKATNNIRALIPSDKYSGVNQTKKLAEIIKSL